MFIVWSLAKFSLLPKSWENIHFIFKKYNFLVFLPLWYMQEKIYDPCILVTRTRVCVIQNINLWLIFCNHKVTFKTDVVILKYHKSIDIITRTINQWKKNKVDHSLSILKRSVHFTLINVLSFGQNYVILTNLCVLLQLIKFLILLMTFLDKIRK